MKQIEVPMLLEGFPSKVRTPLRDTDGIPIFTMFVFGIASILFFIFKPNQPIAGFIFLGLALASLSFLIVSYIQYLISVQQNKKVLIIPVKESAMTEGFKLKTIDVMQMWVNGDVKKGNKTFSLGGRQGRKVNFYVTYK